MTGGVKRTLDEMEDFGAEEPEDLNTKILDLLGKFEGKDLVFITKFFKVIYKNNEQSSHFPPSYSEESWTAQL